MQRDRYRILYLGNFIPHHSTENHIAWSLESMGHTVIRVQEDLNTPIHLRRTMTREQYDLFLFTRTWGKTLEESHLSFLRARGIPSVSYHLDLYYPLARNGGIDTDPFWRTDYVFTPDGDPTAQEAFRKKGINHIYQWPGVYGDECTIREEGTPFKRDLAFVGSYHYHPEWTYRQKLIDWASRSYKRRFTLMGSADHNRLRGSDLNRFYAETKIVLGDSLCPNFTYEGYWSDRIMESTGRGAFIIHPYIKGIENCFEPGKEVVFYEYGNFQQLADLIQYYYSHDAEREAIRRAGHERTKRHHTYVKRMERMLSIVFSS